MIGMTQEHQRELGGHVNANAEVGVTCYTCHRGQPVPSEIWFRVGTTVEYMEGWGGGAEPRDARSAIYTSLPLRRLADYLVDCGRIGVHDLEAACGRASGKTADPPGRSRAYLRADELLRPTRWA